MQPLHANIEYRNIFNGALLQNKSSLVAWSGAVNFSRIISAYQLSGFSRLCGFLGNRTACLRFQIGEHGLSQSEVGTQGVLL
jgi:hypothetical protein